MWPQLVHAFDLLVEQWKLPFKVFTEELVDLFQPFTTLSGWLNFFISRDPVTGYPAPFKWGLDFLNVLQDFFQAEALIPLRVFQLLLRDVIPPPVGMKSKVVTLEGAAVVFVRILLEQGTTHIASGPPNEMALFNRVSNVGKLTKWLKFIRLPSIAKFLKLVVTPFYKVVLSLLFVAYRYAVGLFCLLVIYDIYKQLGTAAGRAVLDSQALRQNNPRIRVRGRRQHRVKVGVI